jgi:hypothetical protein
MNNFRRSQVIAINADQPPIAMPELKLATIATSFALVVRLLLQFNQGVALPKWLAPFTLTGLLALMMLLLPWIQKGSTLAFVVGYVAIAFLVINLLILFTLAHLPGKVVKFASESSNQAGAIVVGAVGSGLGVMLKASLRLATQGVAQMKAMVEGAFLARKRSMAAQKLLGFGTLVSF